MREYPYYEFDQNHYEGRFWNPQGKQIAVVACVTPDVDWAAYIGTDAPDSYKELDTCYWTAEYGAKLSRLDAQYFFPEIKLPYRG